MNFIMCFLAFVFFFCSLSSETNLHIMKTALTSSSSKLFSGYVQLPIPIDKADLCFFYNGQKLKTEHYANDKFVEYSFIDSKNLQTLYFVFTNYFSCQSESEHFNNTVTHLQIPKNFNYKCFKLCATRFYDEEDEAQYLTWNITEQQLTNGIIPENSIIFLFNIDFIDQLEIHSWKQENYFRLIPTIILKQNINKNELKKAMSTARLTSIDIDPIHQKCIL